MEAEQKKFNRIQHSFTMWHLRMRIGSFSNDDGDGNQDVKKAIGLLRKTPTLHVHHAFFVHFFTLLARLRRENA